MPLKVEALPLSLLRTEFKEALKRYRELDAVTDERDETAITAAENEYLAIAAEIEKKEKAEVPAQLPAKSEDEKARAARSQINQRIKNMTTVIGNEPEFGSGCDVHVWLSKLQPRFNLFCVEDDKIKPEFEEKFAVGNDFDTMLENKHKNLVAVVNGVK